jgi:hypothetical protein
LTILPHIGGFAYRTVALTTDYPPIKIENVPIDLAFVPIRHEFTVSDDYDGVMKANNQD